MQTITTGSGDVGALAEVLDAPAPRVEEDAHPNKGYAVGAGGWRGVNGPSDILDGETFQTERPIIYVDPDAELKQQLMQLDSTITARRIREALTGNEEQVLQADGRSRLGWMADNQAKAAALRAQFVG